MQIETVIQNALEACANVTLMDERETVITVYLCVELTGFSDKAGAKLLVKYCVLSKHFLLC